MLKRKVLKETFFKPKKLYIIRHAKSSWHIPNQKDFDRPLNNRGLNDAPKMGRRLFEKNIIPELIISSAAKRAKTTAEIIAKEVNYPLDQIILKKEIYLASVESLINLINQIDNQYSTVFLLGHNPTLTLLAEYLCDNTVGSLPTCGIIGIELSVNNWKLVSSSCGIEIYFDYPKKE